MKVGFLFNHDALHQISHTASVVAAVTREPAAEVTVLTSSAVQEARLRSLIGDAAAARVRFVALTIGTTARVLDTALSRVVPFRRLAMLRENRAIFAALDVLVVPESTSLALRDRFGVTGLKFVWIPHGAGDRSIGYRKVGGGFDLTLVAGEKVRHGMLANGVVTPETVAVVGYPKFDTIDFAAPRPPLFADGRPTALYNPHFDPLLSSWYACGIDVLDRFARGQAPANLLCAPHVMLFKRRIHASVEHRRIAWRRDVPARFDRAAGVAVDTGSVRSIDMTYTLGADLYIGDASSQVYEFIARPRPTIFLNPHRLDWQGRPEFEHWQLGEVIERAEDLPTAVARALADPERFAEVQRRAFAWTFDRVDGRAGERAARAILARFG